MRLSLLFTAMLTYGHMLSTLIKTAVLPILKNRQGDTSDYRPIAIVTAMSKILELCIMKLIEAHGLHQYLYRVVPRNHIKTYGWRYHMTTYKNLVSCCGILIYYIIVYYVPFLRIFFYLIKFIFKKKSTKITFS